MDTPRWLLAVPLALAATLGTARASTIRDQAGMFSPAAVRQAEAELNRIERENQIDTTIETILSLDGQDIVSATRRHAERSGARGLFILVAKDDGKIDVLTERAYRRALNETRLRSIQNAFINEFK